MPSSVSNVNFDYFDSRIFEKRRHISRNIAPYKHNNNIILRKFQRIYTISHKKIAKNIKLFRMEIHFDDNLVGFHTESVKKYD